MYVCCIASYYHDYNLMYSKTCSTSSSHCIYNGSQLVVHKTIICQCFPTYFTFVVLFFQNVMVAAAGVNGFIPFAYDDDGVTTCT